MNQYPGDAPVTTSGISLDGAPADIGLRASRESDRELLHAVFVGTRTAEFANAGWHAEEIGKLLDEQFAMQDAYYRRHYPRARFDVVLRGAAPVGRLYHDWSGSEVRLIDIALLPQHRGAGIGGRLTRALVAEAARRSLPMTLHVETDNPVRAFYRRLGFAKTGENGVYEQMRREAAPFDGAQAERIAGLETGAA